MKKTFFTLLAIVSIIFSSCNKDTENKSDYDIITYDKVVFEKMISALDNCDKEQLESLFSSKSLAKTLDIDQKIDDMMKLYKGNFISNNEFDYGTKSSSRENGKYVYYDVNAIVKGLKTTDFMYELNFGTTVVNNKDPKDVGLWRIWLKQIDENGHIIAECRIGE